MPYRPLNCTKTPTAPAIILPHQANVTDCTVHLIVPDGGIRFTGSVQAKILELFSRKTAETVTNTISSMACPAVIQGVEGGLSDEFVKLDGFLVGLMHNYTCGGDDGCGDGEDIAGEEGGGIIWLDWNYLHPIHTGLEMASRFLENHLDHGVILSILNMGGGSGGGI